MPGVHVHGIIVTSSGTDSDALVRLLTSLRTRRVGYLSGTGSEER